MVWICMCFEIIFGGDVNCWLMWIWEFEKILLFLYCEIFLWLGRVLIFLYFYGGNVYRFWEVYGKYEE